MRKYHSIALAALFPISFLFSACPAKIDYSYSVIETSTYQLHKNIKYGEHERNRLDICIPQETKSSTMLFCIHGGAWKAGDKEGYVSTLTEYSVKFGIITAALDYRYIDDGTSIYNELYDIDQAINKVANFTLDKGITVNSAILTGGSAGGHLSALYGNKHKDDINSPVKVLGVVLDVPVVDLTSDAFIKSNDYGNQDKMAELLQDCVGSDTNDINELKVLAKDISPINFVDSNTPKTLIITGKNDHVAPYVDVVRYYDKLISLGVECEMYASENGGHGANFSEEDYAIRAEKTEKFIANCLL